MGSVSAASGVTGDTGYSGSGGYGGGGYHSAPADYNNLTSDYPVTSEYSDPAWPWTARPLGIYIYI